MRAEKWSYPVEVINLIVAPQGWFSGKQNSCFLSFFFQDLDEICSRLKDANKDRGRRMGWTYDTSSLPVFTVTTKTTQTDVVSHWRRVFEPQFLRKKCHMRYWHPAPTNRTSRVQAKLRLRFGNGQWMLGHSRAVTVGSTQESQDCQYAVRKLGPRILYL